MPTLIEIAMVMATGRPPDLVLEHGTVRRLGKWTVKAWE